MTAWIKPAQPLPGSAQSAPRWTTPPPIADEEWLAARSAPDCIIQDYLYGDVGILISAGGVGKTTTQLSEAVHIALGLPLYGLEVRKPGPVLILTAEDSREMLVARLRAVCADMALTDQQRRIVRERVRISDVSGEGLRLTEVIADVVLPTEAVDDLIAGCRELAPVLIVIDPAVSFGIGEARVNDAEQGLIEAARRLRNALGCCVRYIHHSGKANGRDKATDQYAGRGGSAFADGCRMVHVMQPMSADEWRTATGEDLPDGDTAIVLARPKMTYCPPQPPLYIRRSGYRFTRVEPAAESSAARLQARADALLALISAEIGQGHYPTRNSLESCDIGMSRADLRTTIAWLMSVGRLTERARPDTVSRGARTYLHPVGAIGEALAKRRENAPENADGLAVEKTVIASPPPIGKATAAKQRPPSACSPACGSPGDDGEATAKRRSEDDAEVF